MPEVTLIGATGLVGAHVAAELKCRRDVRRLCVYTRRVESHGEAEKLKWRPFPTLDYFAEVWERPGGLTRMADVIEEELPCGDVLLSCLGTTKRRAGSAARFTFVDFAINAAFALAARRVGYTGYGLVSAYGANADSPWLYPRTKGRLEEYVSSLDYSSVVICRPGLLRGERREMRFGESLFGAMLDGLDVVWPGLRSLPYSGIDAQAVASAIVTESMKMPTGAVVMFNGEMKTTADNER